MDIILSNTSEESIYQQIVSQIKAQIMDGTLGAGDALPSMRVLAQQLKISVITTKSFSKIYIDVLQNIGQNVN